MPTRVWNGSSWVEVASIKVWNGSSWAPVSTGNAWNGSAWAKYYPSVLITDQSAVNFSKAGIGGSATARYTLNSSGSASRTIFNGNTATISGEWLVGGTAGNYEVNATWSGSGGSITGPSGWVSLSSSREWTLTESNNYATRTLSVQIRVASTGTVAASATITFDVDSAP